MRGKRLVAAASACAAITIGCSAGPPPAGDALTPGPTAAPAIPSASASSSAPVELPTTRPKPTATWRSTPAQAPVATPFTVDGVVLVNRVHPLASSYVPPWAGEPHGLAPEASAALKLLIADAKARGLTLQVRSGYRSYAKQASSYANAQAEYDEVTTDLYFAKPGMSEHQTGLAVDLTDAEGRRGDDFLRTPQARYLHEHATDFGFIIRYPLNGTEITGYAWEPWHVRYVGREIAAHFAQHPGLTLEEYLGQA